MHWMIQLYSFKVRYFGRSFLWGQSRTVSCVANENKSAITAQIPSETQKNQTMIQFNNILRFVKKLAQFSRPITKLEPITTLSLLAHFRDQGKFTKCVSFKFLWALGWIFLFVCDKPLWLLHFAKKALLSDAWNNKTTALLYWYSSYVPFVDGQLSHKQLISDTKPHETQNRYLNNWSKKRKENFFKQ